MRAPVCIRGHFHGYLAVAAILLHSHGCPWVCCQWVFFSPVGMFAVGIHGYPRALCGYLLLSVGICVCVLWVSFPSTCGHPCVFCVAIFNGFQLPSFCFREVSLKPASKLGSWRQVTIYIYICMHIIYVYIYICTHIQTHVYGYALL